MGKLQALRFPLYLSLASLLYLLPRLTPPMPHYLHWIKGQGYRQQHQILLLGTNVPVNLYLRSSAHVLNLSPVLSKALRRKHKSLRLLPQSDLDWVTLTQTFYQSSPTRTRGGGRARGQGHRLLSIVQVTIGNGGATMQKNRESPWTVQNHVRGIIDMPNQQRVV